MSTDSATDRFKLLSSYGAAVVIAVGGTGSLVAMMVTGIIGADIGLPILAGLVGAALSFLTGQESATRAVRSFERGLDTPTPEPPPTKGETVTVTRVKDG